MCFQLEGVNDLYKDISKKLVNTYIQFENGNEIEATQEQSRYMEEWYLFVSNKYENNVQKAQIEQTSVIEREKFHLSDSSQGHCAKKNNHEIICKGFSKTMHEI